jgi:hypothetical protein
MIKEIKLQYKGLTFLVTGDYIKGAGYSNDLYTPPEEDEFWIKEYNVTEYNTIDDLRDFILSNSVINEQEIERICIDKCKE